MCTSLRNKPTKVTPEIVKQLLDYNPETGQFTWRERNEQSPRARPLRRPRKNLNTNFNTKYAGKEAGRVSQDGYVVIVLLGEDWYAHRLAWMHYYGTPPKYTIDHKKGIRHDNRIKELRDVTQQENLRNKRMCDRNTSGVVGVSYHASKSTWMAVIGSGGKKESRQSKSFFEAVCIRRSAEVRLGYHENHGRQNKP